MEQARREQEAMHAPHQHINQQVTWMEAKLRELGVEPEGLEVSGSEDAEEYSRSE